MYKIAICEHPFTGYPTDYKLIEEMKPKFELYKRPDNKFGWRLRDENDNIVVHQEPYDTKEDCVHAVKIVQRVAHGAIRENKTYIDG